MRDPWNPARPRREGAGGNLHTFARGVAAAGLHEVELGHRSDLLSDSFDEPDGITGRKAPPGRAVDPTNLTRAFTTLLRKAGLRRIRFHDLRYPTATLLLEQGVELVVIKELLGHAHIGVTATVYAHVRLRLQRDAIDILGHALRSPAESAGQPDDGDDPLLCAAPVR